MHFKRPWTLPRGLDSPALPLFITFLIYLALLSVTLRDQNYDFSYFVTAGDRYCNPQSVPKSLTRILVDSGGYDGQFYYRVALDPFTTRVTEFGITFDNPVYRSQRILYPLIVWALSFGHVNYVPILMLSVNFLCVCLLGLLGGLLARSMRLHSLWGLVFPLYPGILLALSRDLTEVLSATLLLASLVFLRRHKPLLATLFLVLAVLSRETVLVIAGGAACVWLAEIWNQKKSDNLRWYFVFSPFIAYSIWQVILLRNWGYKLWEIGHHGAESTLGLPFVGFSKFLLSKILLTQRLQVVDMLLIVFFAVAVAWVMRSSAASPLEKTAWLLYALFVGLLNRKVWVDYWGYLRVLSEFYMLGAIILLGAGSKIKVPVLGCWAAVWLSYFLRLTDIVSRAIHRLHL